MNKVETNERLAELHGVLVDNHSEWDLGQLNLLLCVLEQRIATERDRLVHQVPFKINGNPLA